MKQMLLALISLVLAPPASPLPVDPPSPFQGSLHSAMREDDGGNQDLELPPFPEPLPWKEALGPKAWAEYRARYHQDPTLKRLLDHRESWNSSRARRIRGKLIDYETLIDLQVGHFGSQEKSSTRKDALVVAICAGLVALTLVGAVALCWWWSVPSWKNAQWLPEKNKALLHETRSKDISLQHEQDASSAVLRVHSCPDCPADLPPSDPMICRIQ